MLTRSKAQAPPTTTTTTTTTTTGGARPLQDYHSKILNTRRVNTPIDELGRMLTAAREQHNKRPRPGGMDTTLVTATVESDDIYRRFIRNVAGSINEDINTCVKEPIPTGLKSIREVFPYIHHTMECAIGFLEADLVDARNFVNATVTIDFCIRQPEIFMRLVKVAGIHMRINQKNNIRRSAISKNDLAYHQSALKTARRDLLLALQKRYGTRAA